MAGRRVVQCIGPSAQLLDRKSSAQRTVNLYVRVVDGGEDKQFILESVPGLKLFAGYDGTIRGVYATNDRLFYVADGELHELVILDEFTAADYLRGSLSSAAGFVSMRHSLNQLVIVDGANGYVFNTDTNVLTQITDPDWRGSDFVDEMDGYFIFVAPSTNQFYLSAIDDGSAYDALDFSSADAAPDVLLTHRVRKRELYLFGHRHTEIWVDSGDADFPFVRYNSTPIDIGIVGKYAVTLTTDTLCWIGRTERGQGYVYALNGHNPQIISTQAVDEYMAASTDLTQAYMWSYHTEGGEFVGVYAPGGGTVWVYDMKTQQWHERGRWVDGAWQPMPMRYMVYFGGEHYVFDLGTVFKLDRDTFTTDVGSAEYMVRERTWPHFLSPTLDPVQFRGLELMCSTGNTFVGGQVARATLEISNDGGYTYGSPLIKTLGATGRRMERIRWLRLGSAVDRVFRIRCTDPVPFSIHTAAVDAG